MLKLSTPSFSPVSLLYPVLYIYFIFRLSVYCIQHEIGLARWQTFLPNLTNMHPVLAIYHQERGKTFKEMFQGVFNNLQVPAGLEHKLQWG